MQILVATLRGVVHQQQRAAASAALLPSLVWALRLTEMSNDYVTLLSLNLLLCLHLLNISERLLMLVSKSAFKIANFSSKLRLQDLAPLE